MPVDYSKWNNIEISDDEDDTHPNIDKASLFRWRHQARVEREDRERYEKEQLKIQKQNLENKIKQQEKVQDQTCSGQNKADASKSKEMAELERQKKMFEDKEREFERMEQLQREHPTWNVDNISKDKWNKSILNKKALDSPSKNVDLDVAQSESFFKKHKKAIIQYAHLTSNKDSESFLLSHLDLVSVHTTNFLVVYAVDTQVEYKSNTEWSDDYNPIDSAAVNIIDDTPNVVRQCIIMQYLLEIVKNTKQDLPELIRVFFKKIDLAEVQFGVEFKSEIDSLIVRVKARAEERMKEAIDKIELEEKQQRIAQSPGGIDPLEVFESLPESMRSAFDAKDIPLLIKAVEEMDVEQARYHMQRCEASGLWVPGKSDTPVCSTTTTTTSEKMDGSEVDDHTQSQ